MAMDPNYYYSDRLDDDDDDDAYIDELYELYFSHPPQLPRTQTQTQTQLQPQAQTQAQTPRTRTPRTLHTPPITESILSSDTSYDPLSTRASLYTLTPAPSRPTTATPRPPAQQQEQHQPQHQPSHLTPPPSPPHPHLRPDFSPQPTKHAPSPPRRSSPHPPKPSPSPAPPRSPQPNPSKKHQKHHCLLAGHLFPNPTPFRSPSYPNLPFQPYIACARCRQPRLREAWQCAVIPRCGIIVCSACKSEIERERVSRILQAELGAELAGRDGWVDVKGIVRVEATLEMNNGGGGDMRRDGIPRDTTGKKRREDLRRELEERWERRMKAWVEETGFGRERGSMTTGASRSTSMTGRHSKRRKHNKEVW